MNLSNARNSRALLRRGLLTDLLFSPLCPAYTFVPVRTTIDQLTIPRRPILALFQFLGLNAAGTAALGGTAKDQLSRSFGSNQRIAGRRSESSG